MIPFDFPDGRLSMSILEDICPVSICLFHRNSYKHFIFLLKRRNQLWYQNLFSAINAFCHFTYYVEVKWDSYSPIFACEINYGKKELEIVFPSFSLLHLINCKINRMHKRGMRPFTENLIIEHSKEFLRRHSTTWNERFIIRKLQLLCDICWAISMKHGD